MLIEVLIMCHNFQRRLCWTLSSFLEQTYQGDVLINISHMKDNGSPTTEDVIDFFLAKGLNIKSTCIEDRELFAYPSLVKDQQMAESDADWIMCHSADCVIHKEFMQGVVDSIEAGVGTDLCMGVPKKFHTDCIDTNAKVEKYFGSDEPVFLRNAYRKSRRLKPLGIPKRYHPGGHIWFSMDVCRDKCNGQYTNYEGRCHDMHLFRNGMKTRTDVGFRARIGGTHLVKYIEPMVHLEHRRDKSLGHHTEEQR